MDRLARPVSEMRDEYDVVVVGSGYGGGVAASRLARTGVRVCLLERGRERQPGEYPDTLLEAAVGVQVSTGSAHVGSRLGMFDFHANTDISALVGCGLGGTSLINANVSIRPDERVFRMAPWPAALADPQLLDPYYRRAAGVLRPAPYPAASPRLPKLDANQRSSGGLPAPTQFRRTDINVNFTVSGRNAFGVEQQPCNNCGDCVTGCNWRAKNTTLMNYLPDARNHGAEIFTQCSVHHLTRDDDGWQVHFDWVGSGQDDFDAPRLQVGAAVVVLAAGTLGSTGILLRSRGANLSLSDRLGERFSGNGDVLAFGYDCTDPIDGVGYGNRGIDEDRPVGPCITSVIDRRGTANVQDGSIIEEGSIPGATAALLPAAFAAAAAVNDADGNDAEGNDAEGNDAEGNDVEGNDADGGDVRDGAASGGLAGRIRELDDTVVSLLAGADAGSVARTQTLLVMAHDGADGRLLLDGDQVVISWPKVADKPVFRGIDQDLVQAVEPLGGSFLGNRVWAGWLGSRLITVHPLGGCPMADDASGGVVNDRGQVFAGPSGTDVHDGLYVADGSVIPTSLGVNPLLTITAVAERTVERLAGDRGWTIDFESASERPAGWQDTGPGIRFTESMTGHWAPDPGLDFAAAEAAGRSAGDILDFTVTIDSPDVRALIDDPDHWAGLVGTVSCPRLSPTPLRVTGGQFNLFVDDPTDPGVKNMVYRMVAQAQDHSYFLDGRKIMSKSSPLQTWAQTTTLYVTVHDGDSAAGPVLGRGVLRITPMNFARQLRTMRVTSADTLPERLLWLERFGRFFAGNLWEQYGTVLGSVSDIEYETAPRKRRPLRVGPPEVHDVTTDDGVVIRLTRYRGGDKGPVLLAHGLGVSSLIFAIDTIRTSLLEYLFAAGYDCWLLDFRSSVALPKASRAAANGDDVARYDHPAAVAAVRCITGADDVQIVAHCYGATTVTLSLLGGYLDPRHVRSMVISQISANVIAPPVTWLKSVLRLPDELQFLGFRTLDAYTSQAAGLGARLLDRFTGVYAYPFAQGHCNDPVCHRITFLYGSLYRHDRLNADTHNVLHEMFGVAAIEQFRHLATMVRHARVVNAAGADVYYPHLERMALPIRFLHGTDNRCFLPASTRETVAALSRRNGADLYSRRLIPGYGHIDCIFGDQAVRDVYPHILEHLEATRSAR